MMAATGRLLTLPALACAGFTRLVTLLFRGWWAFKERFPCGSQPFDPLRRMRATVQQGDTYAHSANVQP